MRRNISREIQCKHSKECSSYSVWVGDGKYSRCIDCKNNKYQYLEELKHDYYEPNFTTKIMDILRSLFMVIIIGFICFVIICSCIK